MRTLFRSRSVLITERACLVSNIPAALPMTTSLHISQILFMLQYLTLLPFGITLHWTSVLRSWLTTLASNMLRNKVPTTLFRPFKKSTPFQSIGTTTSSANSPLSGNILAAPAMYPCLPKFQKPCTNFNAFLLPAPKMPHIPGIALYLVPASNTPKPTTFLPAFPQICQPG